MISNRDFFKNAFFLSLIFSYQGVINNAYAGITFNGGSIIAEETQMDLNPDITSDADVYRTITTKSVCPAGTYVYRCGNYTVGFNWLKSARFPTTSDSNSDSYQYTKNYYVGEDVLDLFEQMRTFFGHNGDTAILYYEPDGTELKSKSDYYIDRNIILNNVCSLSNVTCVACPNEDMATVPATTVKVNGNDEPISWNFYTFADCYMTNFEDSTGHYFYLPDDIDDDVSSLSTGEKCYYTNTNSAALSALHGDAIGNFIPSANSAVSKRNLTIVNIPSQTISSTIK